MNKTILIIITALFILALPLASAEQISTIGSVTFGMHFTGGSLTPDVDPYSMGNGTITGTVITGKDINGSSSALNFTHGTGTLNSGGEGVVSWSHGEAFSIQNPFTLSFWFKKNTNGIRMDLAAKDANTGNIYISQWDTDKASTLLGSGSGWGTTNFDGAAQSDNAWHFYLVTGNSSVTQNWVDGVLQDSDTSPQNPLVPNTEDFTLGCSFDHNVANNDFGYCGNGSLDELIIWNTTLNSDEIAEVYAAYDTWNESPEAPPIPAPIVILNQPTNTDITNNPNMIFNYTPTTNYILTSCTLYTNITGSWTANQTDNTITNGTKNSFNSIELDQGDYIWNVQCTDNNSNSSFADNNFTLTVDLTEPNIITDYINQSRYYKNNVSLQINFSDNDNVHAYNISINGVTQQNDSGLNTKFYVANFSRNVTNYKGGWNNLTITAYDGHTANKLKDPKNFKSKNGLFNDYLQYDFSGKYKKAYVKLQLKDKSISDNWESEPIFDRNTFSVRRSDPSKNKEVITIISDQEIYISQQPESKYKEWLIFEDHWLDFHPYDIDIKRISSKEIEVTVKNIKGIEILSFNSIGDLNENTIHYTFFRENVSLTYNSITSNKVATNIDFYLRGMGHASPGSINLIYNYTNYTTTLTSNTSDYAYYSYEIYPNFPLDIDNLSVDVRFNWEFDLLGTQEFTATEEQTVYAVNIDNCSVLNTTAINLTFKRDDTNAIINGTLKSYFDVLVEETTNVYFNISWTEREKPAVCIFPDSINYSIYAQMEYSNPSYNSKTYYLTNTTINNQSNYIDLYFTPNATNVLFTVNNQDDNAISDVYINVLKYDLGTNSHTLNEIIKTDENGEAIGNIVLTTQWYKFLLIYNGELVYETDPVKIITTDKTFRINLDTDFYDFYDIDRGILSNLTFTNSTGNFAYKFINPTGSSVTACLEVVQRDALRDILINKSCSTSASGTILINVGSDVNGKFYMATSTIHLNPTFIDKVLSISFEDGYKIIGKDGIFITFFVRLTLALIGIWSPIVAVILIALADIGLIVAGLYTMSWPTITSYIVLVGITIWRLNRK